MSKQWNRRDMLTQLARASAAPLLPRTTVPTETDLRAAGENCEAQVSSVSPHTLRLSILPIEHGVVKSIPQDASRPQPTAQ